MWQCFRKRKRPHTVCLWVGSGGRGLRCSFTLVRRVSKTQHPAGNTVLSGVRTLDCEVLCLLWSQLVRHPPKAQDCGIIFYVYFLTESHLTFFEKKKRFYLFIFKERGREEEREGEKHQCVVASQAPPTGDLAHNPGMCPDWESNQQPFDSQAYAQSTELHQPGLI